MTYVGWWYVHEVSRKLRIENEVQNRVFCFLHIIFFSNFKSCNMLPLRFLSRNTQENLFFSIKKTVKNLLFQPQPDESLNGFWKSNKTNKINEQTTTYFSYKEDFPFINVIFHKLLGKPHYLKSHNPCWKYWHQTMLNSPMYINNDIDQNTCW